MNFRPSLLFPLLGLSMFGLVSCEPENKSAGPPSGGMPPAEVSVTEVQQETVPIITELPGRVASMRVAEVRARVTGIVQKQLFKEGAEVKEGDVLFQIDPALLEASLDSVQASLARSQANVAQADLKISRNKPLLATKAVSQQDYDDAITAQSLAKADVLASKAALETATINLGYTKVVSPINGRIGQARVTEGALVTAAEATPMGLVQQMDPIYFDFTQSSTEMLKLRRAMESGQLKSSPDGGTRVTLLLEDGSTYKHEGKLLFSDITVDPTTGMVTMRAEFPNPDKVLLPGMFGRGRVQQAVDNKALTVPQRVLARGPNGTATLMVVNGENKVDFRQVRADSSFGDKWVVTGDIKAGERVIVEGSQKVAAGAAVKPVPFVPAPETPAESAKH